MNQAEKETREAVDRLLMEQGAYAPVELLLAEGRLLYADYETWRSGSGDNLEHALFGDPGQSREMMRQAADYARALGLSAETLNYETWAEESCDGLHFSVEREVDSLFCTGYRKKEDMPQMDLFMDTPGVVLSNGIVRALIGRNTGEAVRLLDRLFQTDPGNARLGGLERLTESATTMDSPVQEVGVVLRELNNELRPLAQELLGAEARQFMTPLWRRLMQALEPVAFNPEHPELHRSYAAQEAEDWVQVRNSVEAEPGWETQPLLLRRHARACGRLHLEPEAVSSWFRLCWRFPQQADYINDEAEREWQRYWQTFLELDPELPNRDFPAWTLIHQPGLARRLADTNGLSGPDVPEDFRVTIELVRHGSDSLINVEQIEQRKLLKACNPALFACYLESWAGRNRGKG